MLKKWAAAFVIGAVFVALLIAAAGCNATGNRYSTSADDWISYERDPALSGEERQRIPWYPVKEEHAEAACRALDSQEIIELSEQQARFYLKHPEDVTIADDETAYLIRSVKERKVTEPSSFFVHVWFDGRLLRVNASAVGWRALKSAEKCPVILVLKTKPMGLYFSMGYIPRWFDF